MSPAPKIALCALLLIFLIAGLLLIPYPGVQNDEALFANGIYTPGTQVEHISLFGLQVPIMIMTYVGALKAWLYTPIFAIWAPSPYSLRLPVLLLGVLVIWLFARYLDLIAGRRAALIGAVLLATDVTFLLTITFDWGPVALQQTLLLGGLILVLRFHRQESTRALGTGFFLFGLALWDKALFLWMFSGIAVAAALLYRREIRGLWSARRCRIAALGFVLGALPFLGYNIANGFETFQGKHYSFSDFSHKLEIMKRTVDGTVMGGFLIDYGTPAPVPQRAEGIEAVSLGIAGLAGHPQTGPLPWLIGLAILTAPLAVRAGQGRLMLFFLIAFTIAWFQMLITDRRRHFRPPYDSALASCDRVHRRLAGRPLRMDAETRCWSCLGDFGRGGARQSAPRQRAPRRPHTFRSGTRMDRRDVFARRSHEAREA